uniref:7TM_GPCR_Srx domain-containing protein n=1 Tax=Caenorhabditis tropicalis TaxID=1561998 RepID=A0A1I7TII1_9PELO
MKSKVLTMFFFFVLVARPETTNQTAFIIASFLVLKLQRLTILTIRARHNRNRVNYVMSPGQAIADTTAQTFRCFAFAVEFIMIVLYSRVISYMCQTPAARNIIAAYTVVFVLIHSWEHLLYGIYGERTVFNR